MWKWRCSSTSLDFGTRWRRVIRFTPRRLYPQGNNKFTGVSKNMVTDFCLRFLLHGSIKCHILFLCTTSRLLTPWSLLRRGHSFSCAKKIPQVTGYVATLVALTYLLTYGAEPFLRSCHLCSHSENSQQF
jgi:hypothetical protein